MEQTKIESFIETIVNISTGFILAYSIWKYIVTPVIEQGYLNIHDTFIITMIFTIASVVRSYYWRRFFARKFHKIVHNWVNNIWRYTGW